MTEITRSGSAPAKIDGKLALTKAEQFYMDEVNKALSSHNSKPTRNSAHALFLY